MDPSAFIILKKYCVLYCIRLQLYLCISSLLYISEGGRGSSVGIATRYGLNGPGIESQWGATFSAPVQTGPGAHPASYTMGTGSFLGVNRRGVVLITHPHLQCPGLKFGRAIPLPALRALVACYRENLYLYLYLYISLSV